MSELETIIAAAITLHDEERDISRWEIEADGIKAAISNALPSDIARICRRMSILQIEVDGGFQITCATHAAILDRPETEMTIAGADQTALQQAKTARHLGDRMLALRGRLRRMDSRIGDVVSSFRDETLEARLLRIAGDGDTVHDLDGLLAAVRADHASIADAIGDWRTMHTRGPVLLIAGSSTRDEVAAAVRHLEAEGFATHTRSLLHGPRWTLRRSGIKQAIAGRRS